MKAKVHELNAYKRLPLPVVSARGCQLVLSDGREILDLYGGHCVNTLGAGDERLGAVIAKQWHTLSFATNLLDHAARHEFLRAFALNAPAFSAPDAAWEVFCSNSGAEANENAIKLALAATKRQRVIAFSGAFHGRTAAAAALTDNAALAFPRAPFEVVRLPWNQPEAVLAAVDERTGAVLLEPYQSLAGVTEPSPEFLRALRNSCDRTGAMLVFDEVQTGSGRLGQPWASQYLGVVPDIFTTAKGAAGGLPIGLTVVRAQHTKGLPGNLLGSTFGGGPVVLAAAAEVARRIAAPGFLENVRATSEALRKACLRGPVESVRGAGLLLGLVLKPEFQGAVVRNQLLAQGVLVGTSDDPRVLRLSPPLVLEPAAAHTLAHALESMEVRV